MPDLGTVAREGSASASAAALASRRRVPRVVMVRCNMRKGSVHRGRVFLMGNNFCVHFEKSKVTNSVSQ